MRGGPRAFPQGFTCPVVLWIPLSRAGLRIRGCHPLCPPFPGAFCCRGGSRCAVLTPGHGWPGLGSFPFARRYLGNRRALQPFFFFLFLRLLRCFSSPGSLPCVMDWRMDAWGVPMRVSPFRHPRLMMDICSWPRLFAAYHVFHRLSVPRHPPCALCCLTCHITPGAASFYA